MKPSPVLIGAVVGLLVMLEPLSYAAAASSSCASPSGAESSSALTGQEAASATSDPEQPRLSLEEATARLDALMEQIEKLRGAIDRTQFDLDALSRSLGGDVDEILRFAREEIAFEQYPGLLRGAQGTLMSRAGNALDQAVLLSTLLEDAGYETRIARGRLTAEQAKLLLQEMARPRGPDPTVGPIDTIREILAEMGRLADLEDAELAARLEEVFQPEALQTSELYREAERDAEFILARLEEAGIALGQPGFAAEEAAEARDYFWLEYRLRPSDPWTPAHPAFVDASDPPVSLEATGLLPQEPPAELEHRVRIQAFIEQTVDGKATFFPIMDPWEQPARALLGEPITYLNYPNGVQRSDEGLDMKEALIKTTLFVPLLNSRPAAGALAFDLNGNRYELNETSETRVGARPLAKETRGLLGSMSEALEGVGPKRQEASSGETLTSFRIDYKLIAPGGEMRAYSRFEEGLSPRPAGESVLPAAEETVAVKAGLVRLRTSMVAAGRYPASYVLDRQLAALSGMADIFQWLLASAYGQQVLLEEEMPQAGPEWLGHLGTYHAFDLAAAGSAISYRPEPSLAVYLQGLCPHDLSNACFSMDVVSNRYRALGMTEGLIQQDPEAAVRMGTWVTHAESIALDPDRERTRGAPEALADAVEQGVAIRLLGPRDESNLRSLALSERMKGFIAQDLRSGYAVLVPERVAREQDSMSGWWRVNPQTGDTLGRTADGRGGGATAEWLWTNLAVAAFSTPILAVCIEAARIVGPALTCSSIYFCTAARWGVHFAMMGALVYALVGFVGTMLIGIGYVC